MQFGVQISTCKVVIDETSILFANWTPWYDKLSTFKVLLLGDPIGVTAGAIYPAGCPQYG